METPAGIPSGAWDYLIVTASNDRQAAAYQSQLAVRRGLGLLPGVGQTLVIPDPGGRRVGSGGSTLYCLLHVLSRELQRTAGLQSPPARSAAPSRKTLEGLLRRLRVLIIHAGGDSRRLPAYGPCGKVFVPVPGDAVQGLGPALFDRLFATFAALRPGPEGLGQVVVTAGDALVRFDPSRARLDRPGITALGSLAPAQDASAHGVFCGQPDGRVRLYLQKPSPEEQARQGALDENGRSVLDIGVMSFDGSACLTLLQAFGLARDEDGGLALSGPLAEAISTHGLDIYREVCCALGTEATPEHHRHSAWGSGSAWDAASLERLYQALHSVPFHLGVLPGCRFLHFGTTRQVIESGQELVRQETGHPPPDGLLVVGCHVGAEGSVRGADSWVEGCRVEAPLDLGGSNVVVGVDVSEPLALPLGACLDVTRGRTPDGREVWFARCCGVGDTFKDVGGTFCGRPIAEWLRLAGARPEDLWDADVPPERRSLWNARVTPAENSPEGYRRWLWMFDPAGASPGQKQAFRQAERFSANQIALLADQDAFHARRREIRASRP